MKSYSILLAAFLMTTTALAQGFDHDHRDLTMVLKVVVHTKGPTTQVDYAKLKADPVLLNRYLKNISTVKKAEFDTFNKNDQQAFLINAYNAYTLKLIIDHYPVKSIKKIGSVFSSPWKIKFFKLFEKDTTLDEVEHEMLRKNYTEPRVHFAVNCASIGCPALRNEAYVGARLDTQLNEQTALFLKDITRNQIVVKNKKLKVSKIFSWFEDDFKKNGSSVQKFVAPYITEDKNIINMLNQNQFSISYLNYDWNLNSLK